MAVVIGQPASVAPETVVVTSGTLRLKAFLWRPNGPGPFPVVLFNHGSGRADADQYSRFAHDRLRKNLRRWVGKTSEDGHNFLYLGVSQWEHDVFGFLDEYVKH